MINLPIAFMTRFEKQHWSVRVPDEPEKEIIAVLQTQTGRQIDLEIGVGGCRRTNVEKTCVSYGDMK